MKDEKILSNEELLDITGGSNFLQSINRGLLEKVNLKPLLKYGVAVMLYAVHPIEPTETK